METSKIHRNTLPPDVVEALHAILDDLWEDEERDFHARSEEDQDTPHVFHALRRVRRWLNEV